MTESREPVEIGQFDLSAYERELGSASDNREIGTSLWYENSHVRVWEVRLQPGERAPFHAHVTNYFWTVVDGGRGLQRKADGYFAVWEYEVGQTTYLENRSEAPLIHDLENIGKSELRFVTVELLNPSLGRPDH